MQLKFGRIVLPPSKSTEQVKINKQRFISSSTNTNLMKKSILALLFLFSTGIAFSQTTVTLQDQCNCEVLKGTDVSGSGATTPAGADLGDIYVNTNTGTIYFWDGDTWELTASDDQQLTGFTFNDATNTLSLTLENGGSVNVDLSSLSDTLTDSNTTVTSFGIDGTNTNLVITDSDSNTFAVALADLAALIDTDTQLTDAQVATAVNNEFPNLDTDSTDDFSGDFGDLTNVPANLDTDSTDDFDGQWSSLTGVPADFADNVDNVDDADNDPANELQAITSTDGTVTVTPNGNDFDLSGFSGDFGDLSNVPANLDTDSTDDFDGQWSSLTGVPAGFADNIDNDTQLTDAQVATAVNNEFPNLDTDSTDDFSGDFGDLTNVPANLDLDSTDDFDGQWSSLTGVPAGFADNIDNDTQLTDAQVATAVNNEFPNLDTDSTDDFSGDFGDLTNVPANLDLDSTDDFDGQWSSLTGVPADFADNVDNVDDADNDPANELQAITSTDGTVTVTPNGNDFDLSGFSGDFGDLSNVPANLDTDSTDDFDGQWSSLTGIPADFADNVDNVDDADNDPANELQAITSTDGTVTVTPNGNDFDLSGFSGDFGDLSNVPANLDTDSTDDFSGDFNDLTNVPANLDTDSTDDFSGDFNDLTNVPANLDLDSTDDFDGQWSSLTGVPAGFADNIDNDTQLTDAQVATAVNNEFPNLDTDSTDDFSGDFGDLTNVPANLDLDSTDDFDGQWSSLTGIPADFADNVDNVDDADNDPANELQAITSTDGTVTVTPNGNDFDLSGFSGDFGDLSNVPANLDTDSTDDFSGDFGDLTNVPANLDLDSTDDFDGQWSSLTGIPAGFADNIDNDTQLTDAQVATAVNNEFPNLDTDSTDDFSGDFGDLTNVPANLDLDSTDDFDGQWSSLTGIPADFADNVDNVDDADNDPANELQAITSTDGTVTVTPNGNDFDLSGFSGDFGDLSNVPANLDTDSTDDFSGDFNDLTNVPANLDTDSTDDFSGDFNDLTNVPANLDLDATDDFDGQWSSLTGVPAGFADNIDNDTQLTDAQVATAVNNEFPNLDTDSTDDFSGDFGDLTNVPANLDLDATDDFDGQWSSLTGIPADFADNVDNVDDADNNPVNELQAITSTDGTVTVTPNGNDFDLSSFSGDFGDLSNVPANLDTDSTDDFSGDFGDLINVPANLDLDSTDDFDGQWSSLTGVPAGFADNIDNDTQLTDAQVATAVNNEFPNLDTDRTDDFSGDFGDLTNVPANLDLDSTDDFDGQWSSLTGIPADFADNVDNVDDADNDPANELQAITSTDGTVTVTPNGNDFDLSGFSGDFGDLSNIPTNLDTDSTDDFDGQWSSLTGVPAGFADNIDNDTQLTDAQVATAVNNEFPNLDTDSTDDFSGDFGDLTNVPANLDLDSTDDFDGQWSSLTGVPAGFADNIDNDTQLTDAQVATAVNNEFPNLDTDSTDDFSGDFGDLTNVPANLDLDSTDDFDGQWSSLTGVPADFADNVDNVDDADNDPANELQAITSTDGTVTVTPNGNDFDLSGFSGDFGDLSNVPANLDTDSTDDFDGQWSSLTGIPADFADNVDNVDDADNDPANELQAITSTDGTVTVTPNGNDFDLSGFSGDFGDLSNVPANLDTDSTDDFSGDFNDLTNVPANLDTDSTDDFSGDFNDLTNVPANLDLDSTDDFDGQWSSLTGVPAGFADNIDNDTQLTDAQVATAVNNEFPNLDTDSTDDFSGDFGDLTNVPANLDLDSTDDFDGQWSSLTGVPAGFADNIDNDTQLTDAQVATAVNNEFPNLDTDSTDDFSGDFGDLTNLPANLDLDSTDDFDGQWSSLTGVPADFADNVDNVDDADNDPANELQAITSTDGTVTVTPNGNDFDLSGFSGDFGDLSNVPANLDTDSTDDFDGQWSSLTGVPADFADNVDNVDDADNDPANELQAITSTDGTVTVTPNGNDFDLSGFSGDFGDLTNVPANLDLDSTDDFDGQWSSLTGIPADFADNVDNVDDADNDPANELQAITSTDGTVTVTPNGNDFDLSGFSGDFGDLSNVPANLDTDSTDDFSGDFNDLTNVPANLDTDSTDDFSGDFGDLTNVPANLDLDSTDDFDGQWSSLTGIPADFADNVDNVDDADASVTNEINTRFEVNGANLEIEDSNGTLQVALADIDTDDQTAAQVNSDSPVDVDGDGNTEATVEDVIQDIAPITSKAARIFYPPSIAIDASTNGTGRTVDLYAQYVAQYGTPAVSSAGAPTALPTYSAAELYYYVTYADPTVFDNMSIDANGVLTYDIIGQPADYNALINVVFVVR